MATKSGEVGESESRQPPETISVGDEDSIELVFRDERLADEDAFNMPEPQN